MFKKYRIKIRIRAFARKLPGELKKQFGRHEHYSKQHVDAALAQQFKRKRSRAKESNNDTYAYVMFCSPAECERMQAQDGLHFDYQSLRDEIANACFNGASDFSFSSLESYASPPPLSSDTSSMGSVDGGSDGGGE